MLHITRMHIDLNLLTALDALLEDCSVSLAAQRLHLSQPAMSRTLARIREATGDPILVRSGRGLIASPRARSVQAEVRELLQSAYTVLSPERVLDPKTLERTFSIRIHDALLPGLGALLINRLQECAPRVQLRFLAESNYDEGRAAAPVDLELGSPLPQTTGWSQEVIAHDTLAVVARRDHPCARTRLKPAKYAIAMHVVVSRKGRLHDPIDEALKALGLTRRVVASAPTSAAALHFANECNVLVTVAAHACKPVVAAMGLAMMALPFTTEPLMLTQRWHHHSDQDGAHIWLRGITKQIAAELYAIRT
jgi:DNA-binding transcriptional LysR family regulator